MVKRHILHARSNQIINNSPKLPQPTDIEYGELAINYAEGNETISIKNDADEIVSLTFGRTTSGDVQGVRVNNKNATIVNGIASVTISGSDENVGTYTSVQYPSELSGAVPVSGSQTISEAFNSVETTISALTQEVIDKQVQIPIIDHGTSDTTFEIPPNEHHLWGTVSALTITLATPTDNDVVNEYMFEFTSPSTPTVLSLPANIDWVFELIVEESKTYVISIVNNLATYLTKDMTITGDDEYVLNSKEDKSNKVMTIDSNSTHIQYPSARCVYEYIEARLAALNNS